MTTFSRRPSWRSLVRRFPGTYAILASTVLVFLAQWASIWLAGFDVVASLGAKVNAAIAAGQVWRLVTPMFIHAGALHLFVNMYSLHVLGPSVERVFAPGRMFVVYLLSGTAGVVTSLAFSQQPSVGASGAIFGLLGALGMFLFLHRHLLGRMAEMRLRQIVMVAVLNLGLGLMPGIDNWGHVGGLLAGMALAWLIGPRLEAVRVEANRVHLVDHRPWAQVWPKAFLAGGTIAVLAYAAISSPFSR